MQSNLSYKRMQFTVLMAAAVIAEHLLNFGIRNLETVYAGVSCAFAVAGIMYYETDLLMASVMFLICSILDIVPNGGIKESSIFISISLGMMAVVLFRIYYKKIRNSSIQDDTPVNRLKKMINCKIEPYSIQILSTLIILSIMASVIFILADPNSQKYTLLNVLIEMLPVFSLLLSMANLMMARWVRYFTYSLFCAVSIITYFSIGTFDAFASVVIYVMICVTCLVAMYIGSVMRNG